MTGSFNDPAKRVSVLMPTQIKIDDLTLLEPERHDEIQV